jgi:rare lipoprotein A
MNKLILAISIVVLCSYITNPIEITEASEHHSVINVSKHHGATSNKSGHHSKVSKSNLGLNNPNHNTASWYGPGFHGRKTANGERYNMYAMTAAHRTLPLSSYAEVTNLKNNRSVIVRINDRGPYYGNRVLDLSYAAAKELGIHKKGTGNVKITPLVFNKTIFESDDDPT